MPAELAGQHPLLERAAAGDREAFAQLYDTQVDGIYRYLLAWTGDRAEAAALTAEVFSGAFSWLTVTHTTDTEAAAWLTAMARDAVAQRQGPGARSPQPEPAGPGGSSPAGPQDPTAATVAAVARLGDPKREVVVLRLLSGHSLAHTAHLSGFTHRAVLELQLSACTSIWELTSGTTAPAQQAPAAEEFEHHLADGTLDPPGSHPTLAGALAVARSLRQAAPGYLADPDPDLVQRVRDSLLTGAPPDLPHPGTPPVGTPPAGTALHPGTAPHPAAPAEPGDPPARSTHPAPSRVPRWGSVAGLGAWWSRLSTGLEETRLLRRPWLATALATAGIVAVLTLQAFGDPAPTGACGGRPCPPTTTAAVVAAAGGPGSLGTPRTTVIRPSTTTSTLAAPAPAPSTPRTSPATTPPSTRPATTAPPTTAAPRPTTTTRATTTTGPPTSAAPTTTTAAPAPT